MYSQALYLPAQEPANEAKECAACAASIPGHSHLHVYVHLMRLGGLEVHVCVCVLISRLFRQRDR